MERKTLGWVIIVQIFFCQLVFGQERGVVNVSVKQNNGRKQDEVLYRNSYALLIGNSNYAEWNSLPGVERDIPQIEAVLRDKHNFTVEKALNLSKSELRSRIDQFISKYGQDYENRLLIYYAGHGYTAVLQDKRVMGYLVMKDAPVVPPVEESLLKTPKNLGDFRLNAISMDEIENLAKEISTRHALFVFDSCFSGTALYRDNVIEVPQEISSEELEQMRGFLTAGNEKQRVRDDSPFRRAFIKGLEGKADINGDGYILSSELGAFVKREVYLETRNSETPQSPIFGKQTNFTRGDMVFVISAQMQSSILPKSSDLMNQKNSNSGSNDLLQPWIKSPEFKILAKKLSKYFSVSSFSDDLALVRTHTKQEGFSYGFIDRNCNEVIPLGKYDNAEDFSEGLAKIAVTNYNKPVGEFVPLEYGFIDKTGKEIIGRKFANAGSFSDGLAKVFNGKKWGFIDKKGKLVIPYKYKEAESFSEGLAAVKMPNGKYGFINKTGEIVILPLYDLVYPFFEGKAIVGIENSKFQIDRKGKTIVRFTEYVESIGNLSEGLSSIKINGKWGYRDSKGIVIFLTKYDEVFEFSGSLALVGIGTKLGYIDKNGNEVIPLKYNGFWCQAFIDKGIAGMLFNGEKRFVDIYGNEYFDF